MTPRCTPIPAESTGKNPRQRIETRLRLALSVALHAWQRAGRRSIDDFAAALEAEGVAVSAAQLRKWTADNPEDLRRAVPARVVAAWAAVTGDTRPVDVLMAAASADAKPVRAQMASMLCELGLAIARLNQIAAGLGRSAA